jgi:hypothetical protein
MTRGIEMLRPDLNVDVVPVVGIIANERRYGII